MCDNKINNLKILVMKKSFYIALVFIAISITTGVAQVVTVGSLDDPNATLDVRSKGSVASVPDGILAPKLTGDELAGKDDTTYGENQNGALVYVTAAASAGNQTGKTINVKAPGYYYYDAGNSVWATFASNKPEKTEWFYMPPSLIDVEPGEEKSIDLFNAYNESVTHSIKSGGADLSDVCQASSASDFDYYVVNYDNNLFANISISPAGVMTYDVIAPPTGESYITIVFVRK